jgi:pyruvate dehydrogenase E2 component (dihydrolipoamide acetyltransferase)
VTEGITKLGMPKWGLSMKEGKLVEWLVAEGAELQQGSEVAEVETEKINGVVEAPAAGTLRRLVAQVGETLPVGALLGVIADASVSDAELDAYITEFQATFVPEEADEDAGPATESATIGGRSIRYARYGEGDETLVLLHGFGGDLNNWLFNAEALAADRTVLALDLPGHGGSSKDVGDGSLASYAAVLGDFLDAVGVDRAHLVGHSLGGATAGAFAVEHPERTLSLTLIGSAGFGDEINADYIEGFIGSTSRRELKPHLEQLFADPSVVTRQLVDDVLKFKRLDGVTEALRTLADGVFAGGRQTSRLGEIPASVPVLVIWGSDDRIIPSAHSSAAPAHARVELLQGQGHSPHMEASGDVNRLIQEFLVTAKAPA